MSADLPDGRLIALWFFVLPPVNIYYLLRLMEYKEASVRAGQKTQPPYGLLLGLSLISTMLSGALAAILMLVAAHWAGKLV